MADFFNDVPDEQNSGTLWESEERFRKIFECGVIGIVLCTPDFRIKDVNPTFCGMLGYSRDELQSVNLLDIIHPDDIKSSKILKEQLQTGQLTQVKMEKRYIRKDGSYRWGATTISLIRSPEGEPLYTIGLIDDITGQRDTENKKQELQEKLTRSKKMEAIGLLASGVAHDLNNLLSVMIAFPDVILMDKTLSRETRSNVEMIRNSGHMAVDLVNDLLTIARGVAIEKNVLDLNATLREYLRSPEYIKLKEQYPAVTVTTDFNKELFFIEASCVHIKKMCMNLIANAFEAIHDKAGKVMIATENRVLHEPKRGYMSIPPGDYAVLRVRDTGEGISTDDLERIFEPFFSKKILGRSGSGLGLAVVWNAMHDHGGFIDVKSDAKGTTFELYFPESREKILSGDMQESLKKYRGNGQCVLIIEEEEKQRDILSTILKRLDYTPKAFASGEEAIAYLRKNTADLIILDMILSNGMNGSETYEKILKINPDQRALLANGLLPVDEVLKVSGFSRTHCITKPYSLEGIGEAVKNELEKHI